MDINTISTDWVSVNSLSGCGIGRCGGSYGHWPPGLTGDNPGTLDVPNGHESPAPGLKA